MMTTEPATKAHAPRLTIRTLHTLGGNGEETITSTVFCPFQERSVAVDECEACERFVSLHFDPSMKASSVVCTAGVAVAEEGAVRDAAGGPPNPATPLADIMTREVVCVRADVDLAEVREIMLERGFGGVPVVDETGKPVGIVSRADVLRLDRDRDGAQEAQRVTAQPKDREDLGLGPGFHVYEPAKLTAGDAMTPIVLALHESSNIGQASSLMAYEGIHRLPVVADDGRIVGILSSLDVLRWFGRKSGYIIPAGGARRHV